MAEDFSDLTGETFDDLVGEGFPVARASDRGKLLLGHDEALNQVLEQLVSGNMSLKSACEWVGVNVRNVMQSFSQTEKWREKYLTACRERAALLAEEAIDISDSVQPVTDDIRKAELRIETRKWFASRLDPDRWESKKQDNGGGQTMVVQIASSILTLPNAQPQGRLINGDAGAGRRA